MEDNAPSPLPPARPAKEPSKHDKRLAVAWILTILLALAAGVFAWLYYNQDETVPQATEQTDQSGQNEPTETEDEEDEAASAQTVYQAEVGEFKLELSNKYVVIEKLDGGFEGGPATSIEIGLTSPATPNVVVTNPGQPFSIFARPLGTGENLDNYAQQYEDDELFSSKPNEEIAGKSAKVYAGGSLFNVKHLVFTNQGIVWDISLLDGDDTQADILEAVKTGFTILN